MAIEYPLSNLSNKLMSTQVSLLLIKELKDGIFAQAEKLPSEVELSEQLSVSRTVIRDALSDIEREGFIKRTRGVGTIINRGIVNLTNRLDLKLEYNELIVNLGRRPSTDSISLRLETAGEELAKKLEITPGDEVIVCEKRILADETPVIYSIDYMATKLFTGINYKTIDWSLPVFDILEHYCRVIVTTNITKVRAANADANIRSTLRLQPNDALLLLEEVGYGKPNGPLLCSLGFYTDFFDFSMLRKKF
ncbi:MAG: transcriptional regulator, GntR family [Caproiciproducens sp.]|jgi:GntR family transcriptional regulator|nr:transcriptional regulator, GntR family [Caproiciproducens sp.]